MKKHSMPEMKEGGVNVTPLIDIVMCLIIFFMLVAKIGVTRGVDADIKLPDAILGTKIADLANTFTLNVHDMPRVAAGHYPQVTAIVGSTKSEMKCEKKGGVDSELLRVLKEFKKTHGDKSEVIIRGDAHLDYEELEVVLMTIAEAGITDTAYETKAAGEPDAATETKGAQ